MTEEPEVDELEVKKAPTYKGVPDQFILDDPEVRKQLFNEALYAEEYPVKRAARESFRRKYHLTKIWCPRRQELVSLL